MMMVLIVYRFLADTTRTHMCAFRSLHSNGVISFFQVVTNLHKINGTAHLIHLLVSFSSNYIGTETNIVWLIH